MSEPIQPMPVAPLKKPFKRKSALGGDLIKKRCLLHKREDQSSAPLNPLKKKKKSRLDMTAQACKLWGSKNRKSTSQPNQPISGLHIE